jgi:hypothetical protein
MKNFCVLRFFNRESLLKIYPFPTLQKLLFKILFGVCQAKCLQRIFYFLFSIDLNDFWDFDVLYNY